MKEKIEEKKSEDHKCYNIIIVPGLSNFHVCIQGWNLSDSIFILYGFMKKSNKDRGRCHRVLKWNRTKKLNTSVTCPVWRQTIFIWKFLKGCENFRWQKIEKFSVTLYIYVEKKRRKKVVLMVCSLLGREDG